jgi:hypothetical protein
MLVRLVNLLSALLSPILGKLFSFLEPYATGDGTMSLLLRGFAIRRRHARRAFCKWPAPYTLEH